MYGNKYSMFLINPFMYSGGGSSFINDYSTLADGVDEYVSLGVISALNSTSNFSISFWYKPVSMASIKVPCGFQKIGHSVYMIQDTNGDIRFCASALNDTVTVVGATSIGVWYHIALVYDGSLTGNLNRAKIYVDGVDSATISTGTIPSSLGSSTHDFTMFARNGNFPTNCYLDEFSIFDYSLTSTEVSDLYNSGTPTNLMELDTAKRPEHYYRNGDGDTFPTITDRGETGGNDGTMVNAESSDFVLDTP